MTRTVTKTGWVPSYMIAISETPPYYSNAKAIKVTYQVEEPVQEINLIGALRAMADGKTVELWSKPQGCGLRVGATFSLGDLGMLGLAVQGCTFIVVE